MTVEFALATYGEKLNHATTRARDTVKIYIDYMGEHRARIPVDIQSTNEATMMTMLYEKGKRKKEARHRVRKRVLSYVYINRH